MVIVVLGMVVVVVLGMVLAVVQGGDNYLVCYMIWCYRTWKR